MWDKGENERTKRNETKRKRNGTKEGNRLNGNKLTNQNTRTSGKVRLRNEKNQEKGIDTGSECCTEDVGKIDGGSSMGFPTEAS